MTGSILLVTSIITGFISLIYRPRFFFQTQSLAIIAAAIFLEIAFIRSDFSIQNVLFFSSTQKPLIYKIAGLWTNGDSSLLFWTSLLAFVSFISIRKEESESAYNIISRIFALFLLGLGAYIFLFSNPFIIVPKPPLEGMGLNPVLQDVAVSIHPPILYLGYVSYGPVFAYSLLILLRKEVRRDYISSMMFFSKIGFASLSAGIALGSWWAYRELGWGGYWFFDPVENISLLPWLIGIALHHTLMLSFRNNSMLKTTIFLGLLNFILVLFGMMLVRSGSLVSVHSFASNIEAGKYIIAAFGIMVTCVKGLYVHVILSFDFRHPEGEACLDRDLVTANEELDQKAQQASRGPDALLAKLRMMGGYNPHEVIYYSTFFIYLAALSIFVGIVYPPIYNIITGVSISLNNNYFQNIFLPLGLIITLFTLAGIFVGRKRNHAKIFSHVGLLIMVIGMALNSHLNKDLEFVGKEKETVEFADNIKVKLQNIRYADGPNYYRQIAEFWLYYNNEVITLKPENRLYRVENMLSAESDIHSFVAKDFYVVLGNVDGEKRLYANIYIRPFMSLIWLGMFLTASGVVISIFRPRP